VPYSAHQAARLSACSPAQLSYWQRIGLVAPRDSEYSFRDLVALRVVASLLEAGLPLGRVRQAVRYLVASGEDIAGLRLVTNGDRVWACRDDGQILDALRRGQLALFVEVDAYAREVDAQVKTFDAERREFVQHLQASS
jgi:DNA-binding transcriptional MerR regulator